MVPPDELESEEERASVSTSFFPDLALMFLVSEGQPSHRKKLVCLDSSQTG